MNCSLSVFGEVTGCLIPFQFEFQQLNKFSRLASRERSTIPVPTTGGAGPTSLTRQRMHLPL